MSDKSKGWYGFDFDGTLAEHDGTWKDPDDLGKPIPLMVNLVKKMLDEGKEVRIMTARVSSISPEREKCIKALNLWCKHVFGKTLPLTAEKDHHMIALYDDRAKQVIPNTGILLESLIGKGVK